MSETQPAHAQKIEKFEKSYYERPIPKSGLQAAELEQEAFGSLRVRGRNLEYVDLMTKIAFLTLPYCSPVEAAMQMKFYKQAYQDVLDRRANFTVVN